MKTQVPSMAECHDKQSNDEPVILTPDQWQALAEPSDPAAMRVEIEQLSKTAGGGPLAAQGGLEVYLSGAQAIPHVLHEIGRLREACFRDVGEGTGRPVDLDHYDEHYLHLILWDPSADRVAGAYRMGRTDTIMAEFGPEGLLTSSFFHFEQPFLDFLNPGLELGRAFVTADYQKSIFPLALLWRGVGAFLLRYPRYHRLFGCVSISDDYTRISQDLMVSYMRNSHNNDDLSRYVSPTNAYPDLPDGASISDRLQSIEQVSAAVAEAEPDSKGVPVLLRQYLKLNATLLEFNVDPLFNNSLDALVLVDMREVPAKMLKRYFGKDFCKAMGKA